MLKKNTLSSKDLIDPHSNPKNFELLSWCFDSAKGSKFSDKDCLNFFISISIDSGSKTKKLI